MERGNRACTSYLFFVKDFAGAADIHYVTKSAGKKE